MSRHVRLVSLYSVKRAASLIVLAVLTSIGGTHGVKADTLDVNATVPYETPSQPAVIQPSLNGSSTSTALVTVSGNCQVMTPQGIVSIVRNGVALGSAGCTGGTFSLQVMLAAGSNLLVARTANLTGNYGPDGTPVSLTLNLPAATNNGSRQAAGGNPATDEPATVKDMTRATAKAAASGLQARPAEAFSVLSNHNRTALSVVVSGGTPKYRISINWGNGRTQSRVVDGPGTYSYNMIYDKPGTYMVLGKVSDAAGAYAEFSYAVVSGAVGQPAEGAAATATGTSGGLFGSGTAPIVAAAAGGLVTLLGVATFIGFKAGVAGAAAAVSSASAGGAATSSTGQAIRSGGRAAAKAAKAASRSTGRQLRQVRTRIRTRRSG